MLVVYALFWFNDRLQVLAKMHNFASLRKSDAEMKKIGLLSDTHSYWDDKYVKYFSECDEIWHAGVLLSWPISWLQSSRCVLFAETATVEI